MEEIKRVLVVGTENVGKTALLQYFTDEEESAELQKTLGMEVHVQVDDSDTSRSIEYYELGGSASKYKEIAETYIQVEHFDGIIAVFDLYNTKSIESITNILDIYQNASRSGNEAHIEEGQGGLEVPLLIIGNKKDLIHNERRVKQMINELIGNIRKKFGVLFGHGRNIFYSSSGLPETKIKGQPTKRQFDVEGFEQFTDMLFRGARAMPVEPEINGNDKPASLRERFLFF